MKRIQIVVAISLIAVAASTALAQREAPAGASDAGPADRNIKTRSAELERVKREADKPDAKAQSPAIAAERFQQIKEDFEGLQLRQDGIRKVYTEGKQIDMAKIGATATLMNANATRLHSNLFPPLETQKKKKKSKEQSATAEPAPEPLPQDLRSMIVAQDDALAAFVANPMFTNPTVANVDDNARAQSDLMKLIRLTAALVEMTAKKPQ